MGANMRCEKNSLALLSGKCTKAFSKSRADEAFALPSFSDMAPALTAAAESTCRSNREPKAEHCAYDIEKLKQTMLRHESMFKEQLYELHRLYRVQKLLMEESQRNSLTSHPRSDSPSLNGFLLYTPDLCRQKDQQRFWEAGEPSKSSASKQLPFFSGQIDVNKPHEDRHNADRLVNASCQDSQRPVIDLEQPAEEHVDTDIRDEKPILRNPFFQPLSNLQLLQTSSPGPQHTFQLGKSVNPTMHEQKSSTICRESPSSSKWRNFGDCFTPKHLSQKEVPFFSVGSTNPKDGMVEGAYDPPSQTKPITSLFGVQLNQDANDREICLPAVQGNSDHKMRETLTAGSDACDRSTGQTSKVPHWLLQGLQRSSATKISSGNPAYQRQHQSSLFFLQKQGEKTSLFEERVSCSPSKQEPSDPFAKKAGGNGSAFGGTFLHAPPCKPSSGYVVDALGGNVQGFPKLTPVGSVHGSTPLVLPPSSIERHRVVSTTDCASSSIIMRRSPVSEADASPAFLLKELGSKVKSSGSPEVTCYQQRATSPGMPQVPTAGVQNQSLLNAFSVSSLSSWVNAPACDQAQEGISVQSTRESNLRGIADSSRFLAAGPEDSSKRPNFGFMPTASELDLTLGFDLNDDETLEQTKIGEGAVSNGHVAQRSQNKICSLSGSVRNDFDLNEQFSQVMDAESHAAPTGWKHEYEICSQSGWRMSNGGVKPTSHAEWQSSHNTSSLKSIPDETTASTVTLRQPSVSSVVKVDMHGDLDEEQGRVNGSSIMAGRSSDGSVLTSCESRSTPVPVIPKARDDSILSGGACGSMATRRVSQEMLFEDATVVMEMKRGMFSPMLPCGEVYQVDIGEESWIEKRASKDNLAINAGCDKINTHKAESFEAADILLLLSLDSLSEISKEQGDDGDQERALQWLADSIPQDDMSGRDGGMAGLAMGKSSSRGSVVRKSTLGGSELHPGSVGIKEKMLDSFELSVLSLKPIDPESERIYMQATERCDVAEECLPPPNLRRRSLRRGRVGKDFQKEMLPSIASLSRQEITEDLQILEGLVKSATEAMVRCSFSSKEDLSWSLPALSSAKAPGKAKGFRSCKAGKQNELFRVCSWGESTRRRRMRRQRRVCVPPGI